MKSYLSVAIVLLLALAGIARPVDAQTGPAPGVDDLMGLAPYQSYHGGDIDNVNLSTGSLSAQVQLISYPQRGALLKESFSINYNSNPYHTVTRCPPDTGCEIDWVASTNGVGAFVTDDQDAPAGYNRIKIGLGYYCYFSIVTPDKARHPLEHVTGSDLCTNGLTSAQYESIDTTAYQLALTVNGSTNPSTVTDPAGVRYYYVSLGQQPTVWKEDPNGNQILRSFTGTSVTGSIDTIGRAIPLPTGIATTDFTGCPQGGTLLPVSSAKVWSPPGYAGGTLAVKYCYASVPINLPPTGSGGTGPSAVGMVQSVVLPNGTAWSFEYQDVDGSGYKWGNLTKITFPTGGTISYVYTAGASLFSRVVSSRTVNANDGTGGHQWAYSYGLNSGTITRVHDPLGNDTDHTLTSLGANSSYETKAQYYQGAQSSNQLLKTIATVYSSNQSISFGNMAVNVVPTSITTTWPSAKVSKTTRTYDSAITNNGSYVGTYGKVLTENSYDYGTNAAGPLVRTTVNNYQFLVNSNYKSYNIVNAVQSAQIKNGGGTQVAYTFYNYDENTPTGSGISLQHNSVPVNGAYRGNQTSAHGWLNTNGTYLVSTDSFYDTGNVYQSKDPLLNPTTFSYSPTFYGSLVTQVTNAANQSTNYNYDFNTGLLASVIDPNSQTTSYVFDPMNRLTQITYATGGGTATLCYTDTGGAGCTQAAAPYKVVKTRQITGALNQITTAVVDGLGRILQTQLNSDPDGVTYADITYDGVGHKATESNPYRTTSDSTYGITSYQYDGMGRPTKIIPSDGSASANNITTNYSTFPAITVTDQAGHSRKSQSDALGHLIYVWEDPAGLNYETDYAYDVLDNLLTVNQKGGDPNSANWRPRTFTYNSLSELLTANNPESGTITYTYDNDRNLLAKVSPAPNQTNPAVTQTISYCYDQLNRITGKAYSLQSCPLSTPAANYFYDQTSYNGLTIANGVGRRTGMSDAAGAEAWNYDSMGRVLRDRRTTNSVTLNTDYTYNLDGSVATEIYPSGRTITYSPGAAGRSLAAKDIANSINYVTVATYAAQGALATFMNGASISGAMTYNSRLQPLQLYFTTGAISPTTLTQLQSSPCPTAIASVMSRSYNFGFGNNDNGNIQNITNCRDTNRTQNFSYDNLNRIGQAYTTGTNWGEDFTIDPWGNLTNRSLHSGKTNFEPLNAAPATNNKLTGFGYDAAGNMTSNGSSTYTYDAENRLVSAGGATYTYDGDGNRLKKSSGTLYWGAGPLAESDLTASAASWNEYVFFGGKRVARRTASNSSVHYFFSDHLGSSSIVTNSTGATLEEDMDYYPYGGTALGTSSDHYLFTGKERDAESGLDNFGARYDTSSLGRFMSPDPLLNSGHPGNPQTWNRYAYTLNNPLNIIDPLGLYNVVSHCVEGQKGYKQCVANETKIAENLKKGLDQLQKKVDKMKDGLEKARLQAALKAFGTEGDENNVFVSAGKLGPNTAAETRPGANATTGEVGFDVVFDPAKGSNNDLTGIAINGAHEGTHVADISDPRFSDPTTTLSPFGMEYRGYQTSAWAASALGESSLAFGDGKYVIWNSSWAAVDDKVLTRYIKSFKDDRGNVTHPETTPHNPWSN